MGKKTKFNSLIQWEKKQNSPPKHCGGSDIRKVYYVLVCLFFKSTFKI